MSVTQKSTEMLAGLSVLEVPYGHSLVSDPRTLTFDDQRNSAATAARYTAYLAQFGVKSLDIHQEVPAEKQHIRIGEFLWELGLMDMEPVYQAPEWVCKRMNALQKANVPFAWFLYADEHFAYPKVVPTLTLARVPEIVHQPALQTQKKRDPAIIGVIPTDYKRRIGWWYLIAAWLH